LTAKIQIAECTKEILNANGTNRFSEQKPKMSLLENLAMQNKSTDAQTNNSTQRPAA